MDTCTYVNPLICWFLYCLMTDRDVRCSKILIPTNYDENDVYGLKELFSMKMPDPEIDEDDEPLVKSTDVSILSYEFLAMISTFIIMSPWYAWRNAANSKCSGFNLALGPMEKAEQWYTEKLQWYKAFFVRDRLAKLLEHRMTQFFKDRPMAWANVLTIKGTQNTGIAKKKARRSSGAPAGAPPQPLDEDCPMD